MVALLRRTFTPRDVRLIVYGNTLDWTYSDQARMGDHRWWISDLSAFKADYPEWELQYDLETTLRAIHDFNVERWSAVTS